MEIIQNKADNTKDLKADLEELAVIAEDAGCWLYCYLQNTWLTPDELREYNAKGLYLWDLNLWELKDPKFALAVLERQESAISKKLEPLRKKLKDHKPKTKIKIDQIQHHGR